MTDAQQALAQVREALEAGPTPGEWVCYDDSSDGKTNRIEIVAIGKTVARIYRSVQEQDLPNARLIAACSPANVAAILAHVEAQAAEIERLRDLLRVEQALALRQDPFRCYDIECQWFGRPVRAGDCQCHHLQATTHRANVRDALANRSSDE